jgi:antitoxin component YwqK of YwqJK toxin-antitoxin module
VGCFRLQSHKGNVKTGILDDMKSISLSRVACFLVLALSIGMAACKADSSQTQAEEGQSNIVKKHREDGTLSSLSPVDEEGYIHGVKVNFYEDGLTVHSKVTYEHGRKHGPAMWFFKSGKIYEHTTYYQNRKNGITKRYYETGELYEETSFDTGEELPGAKKYRKDGTIIED